MVQADTGAPASVRLVIVEDHEALRRGTELIARRESLEVVGVAGLAARGEELIRKHRPDVAVIDIRLPDENGTQLTRRLLGEHPGLGVILYTGLPDWDVLGEAIDCGARGFSLKAGPPQELIRGVRVVAAGGNYIDPRLAPLMLSRETTGPLGVLSDLERDLLDLLGQGLSFEESARRLSLPLERVLVYLRSAAEKLESGERPHAVAMALRRREIEEDPSRDGNM